MEKDIKAFGEIYLDTDTDPKLNKGSDYILNTIVQADGRFGIAINAKGNTLVTDNSLLATIFPNTNSNPITVVGSCVDEARNRIIYHVVNLLLTAYDAAIFYYDMSTGGNKCIYHDDDLNYTYDTKITGNIVGDLHLWTDGVNPPRKINYIKAYNYQNGISTDYKYQYLSGDLIESYRRPPSYKPVLTAKLSSLAPVVISNKSFQFAYRYVYDDYEKSVLSPLSDIIFTNTKQLLNGTSHKAFTAYAITVKLKLFEQIGGNCTDINSIEIFIRYSDISNWYLYDTIKSPKTTTLVMSYHSAGTYDDGSGNSYNSYRGSVSEYYYNQLSIGQNIHSASVIPNIVVEKYTTGSTYIIGINAGSLDWGAGFVIDEYIDYLFKDNKVRQPVDQNDIIRPYDFLPKIAGTQELIEKDKILYANITEGFDNTIVDITSTIISTSPSLGIDIISSWQALFHVQDVNTFVNYYYVGIYFTSYANDTTYFVSFKNSFPPKYITATYTQTSPYSNLELEILTGLANAINAQGVNTAAVVTTMWGVLRLRIDYIAQADVNITESAGYAHKFSYKTLKDFDSYLCSIRYYDKNLRFSGEQKSSQEIVVNDRLFDKIYTVSCSIKNRPPLEAYYYSINFTKRQKSAKFLHIEIRSEYYYYGATDGFLRIQLNNYINNTNEITKGLKLESYTYEEGDRILIYNYNDSKFVEYNVNGIEWPKTDARYQKDYSTSPTYILDAEGNKINNPYSQVIVIPVKEGESGVDFSSNYLLKMVIFHPKKEVENPYYFPCYFSTVGNPGEANNYHISLGQAGEQNQNENNPVSSPAILLCNPGDVYLKIRLSESINTVIDENYSDFYESNSYGLGSPGIYNPDAKEEQLISGIRYSGSLVEDANINKLNQFKSGDLQIHKSKYGTIRNLKEIGTVLKVMQDRKETSIYIGRSEMKNADYSQNLIKATELLGSANPADEDRGTIFFRSFIAHNRNCYYYDLYRAEVIRSAPNGQIPISEYGMRTWFKDKSAEIISAGVDNCDVIGSFDEENKMYIITFILPSNSETIAFYDPEMEGQRPRWISFFSFIPEHYESFGTTLLSFKDGKGYKHNNNSTRCTFYGVKYKQQINWYSNPLPTIKKIFKSLAIKSNKAWDVPALVIEADATYIRGMSSLLKPNHFTLKEGQYFAEYLNNMKTTSSTDSVVDLFNGDKLRGYYLKHTMENLEDVECWLMNTEVCFDPSNQSY